jgi:hypothetical protein
MIDVPMDLQYGALGLLAGVLTLIGTLGGWVIRRLFQRLADRDTREAQLAERAQTHREQLDLQEQERRAHQDEWMRQLVEGGRAEQQATIRAISEISTQAVEAQRKTADLLGQLSGQLRAHDQWQVTWHEEAMRKADMRHEELLAARETRSG